MGGVKREDLLLFTGQLQPQRPDDLYDLFQHSALLSFPHQPYRLHGERAAPAYRMPCFYVLDDGPAKCKRVKTRVKIKGLVLEADKADLEFDGDVIVVWKAPLPVLCDLCRQQVTVLILQDSACLVAEKRSRQAKSKPGQQQYCRGVYDLFFCGKPEQWVQVMDTCEFTN